MLVQGGARTLSSYLNPQCNNYPEMGIRCNEGGYKLYYVRADGDTDTIHHLWSFDGTPSMIIIGTDLDSKMSVDWTLYANLETRSGSITFNSGINYSFGIAITKLWAYNDTGNNGNMLKGTNITALPMHRLLFNQITNSSSSDFVDWQLQAKNVTSNTTVNWLYSNYPLVSNSSQHFNWSNTNLTDMTYEIEDKTADLNKTTFESVGGYVQMTLDAFGSTGRSGLLPHLEHTYNSAQMDVVLNNLAYVSKWKQGRVALEIVLISGNENITMLDLTTVRSMDDEYSPGIFTLNNLSPNSPYQDQGFLSWRPVAYTTSAREVTDSTSCRSYDITPINNTFEQPFNMSGSLFAAVYNMSGLNNKIMFATNISFGENADGYYTDKKYIAWTFVLGYGNLPAEKISTTVIIVILVGFGLPIILIIVGMIYVIVKKCRQVPDDSLSLRINDEGDI